MQVFCTYCDLLMSNRQGTHPVAAWASTFRCLLHEQQHAPTYLTVWSEVWVASFVASQDLQKVGLEPGAQDMLEAAGNVLRGHALQLMSNRCAFVAMKCSCGHQALPASLSWQQRGTSEKFPLRMCNCATFTHWVLMSTMCRGLNHLCCMHATPRNNAVLKLCCNLGPAALMHRSRGRVCHTQHYCLCLCMDDDLWYCLLDNNSNSILIRRPPVS
jgi:hypothetical protein